ncbi:MAG: indole-3-glycerol phosphate synthase TrpC [Steroidobacteraceae bacterium]
MSGFLAEMARGSAARVARARLLSADVEMLARARAIPEPPPLRLGGGGFDLIAEVKLRSPAEGLLTAAGRGAAADDLAGRVRGYAAAGTAAVSVLTEPSRFDGSLEHLRSATQALADSRVPAMRKDFLVDPYQVLEARLAGAGGVLVILRMLSEAQTDALLDCARDLGLFVLLEAFDEADLERAQGIVARRVAPGARATLLVGVNCRDLDTLQVVPGRLEALAKRLPTGVPCVAESGVGSADDAARVAAAGYDLALVGSALMTSGDPGRLLRDLLAAGRGRS